MTDRKVRNTMYTVVGDAAIAVNRQPTGDPVANWALAFLARHHHSLSVREALRLLGEHAYDKVTAGLIAGGLVEQVTKRRMLGRAIAYPPTNPAVIHHVRGRLRYSVLGYDAPDPQTDALAGLLRALRLESELYLDGFDTDLRGRLRQMLTRAGHHTPATERSSAPSKTSLARPPYRCTDEQPRHRHKNRAEHLTRVFDTPLGEYASRIIRLDTSEFDAFNDEDLNALLARLPALERP